MSFETRFDTLLSQRLRERSSTRVKQRKPKPNPYRFQPLPVFVALTFLSLALGVLILGIVQFQQTGWRAVVLPAFYSGFTIAVLVRFGRPLRQLSDLDPHHAWLGLVWQSSAMTLIIAGWIVLAHATFWADNWQTLPFALAFWVVGMVTSRLTR